MKTDHICFNVKDAIAARDWFTQTLGFCSVGSGTNRERAIEVVKAGDIYFVLCAPLEAGGTVATFLQQHPSGVSELAFCVESLEATIAHAMQQGATLLEPPQMEEQAHGTLKWATLAGWGDLTHTILERTGRTSLLPKSTGRLSNILIPVARNDASALIANGGAPDSSCFTRIDHMVLNVAKGDLERSVDWYKRVLDLQPQQSFKIQTAYSALCSRVLCHPSGEVQLPINEPASPTSQIQEFLDCNRGSGVQHIALETTDLVGTIAQLRQNGLSLIHVPATYYTQLRQRSGLPLTPTMVQQLEEQQILADWQPNAEQAVLLQTFTKPIFDEPTFFFELIQRQSSPKDTDSRHEPAKRAQGFGEGNFRALVEAIEREQMQRGTLSQPS